MTLGQLKRIIREAIEKPVRPNRPLTDLEAADYRKKELEYHLHTSPEGKEIDSYLDRIMQKKKEYWSNKDSLNDDDLEIDGVFYQPMNNGRDNIIVKGWLQNKSFTIGDDNFWRSNDKTFLIKKITEYIMWQFDKSDVVKYMNPEDISDKVLSDITKNSPAMLTDLRNKEDFNSVYTHNNQEKVGRKNDIKRDPKQKSKDPDFPAIIGTLNLDSDGQVSAGKETPGDDESGEYFKKRYSDLVPGRDRRAKEESDFETTMSQRKKERAQQRVIKDREAAAQAEKKRKEELRASRNPREAELVSWLENFTSQSSQVTRCDFLDMEGRKAWYRATVNIQNRQITVEFSTMWWPREGGQYATPQINSFSGDILAAIMQNFLGDKANSVSFMKSNFQDEWNAAVAKISPSVKSLVF